MAKYIRASVVDFLKKFLFLTDSVANSMVNALSENFTITNVNTYIAIFSKIIY